MATLRLAVLDAPVQRLDREAAVDHRMHRADLGAGQHGDGQFGHAAHVDGHPVALLDAHAAQHVGELADFAVEGVVREGAHLAVLALPDQRQLVAPPGLDVAVEAVVDDVGLAADEPLDRTACSNRPAPCPTSGTRRIARLAPPRIRPGLRPPGGPTPRSWVCWPPPQSRPRVGRVPGVLVHCSWKSSRANLKSSRAKRAKLGRIIHKKDATLKRKETAPRRRGR